MAGNEQGSDPAGSERSYTQGQYTSPALNISSSKSSSKDQLGGADGSFNMALYSGDNGKPVGIIGSLADSSYNKDLQVLLPSAPPTPVSIAGQLNARAAELKARLLANRAKLSTPQTPSTPLKSVRVMSVNNDPLDALFADVQAQVNASERKKASDAVQEESQSQLKLNDQSTRISLKSKDEKDMTLASIGRQRSASRSDLSEGEIVETLSQRQPLPTPSEDVKAKLPRRFAKNLPLDSRPTKKTECSVRQTRHDDKYPRKQTRQGKHDTIVKVRDQSSSEFEGRRNSEGKKLHVNMVTVEDLAEQDEDLRDFIEFTHWKDLEQRNRILRKGRRQRALAQIDAQRAALLAEESEEDMGILAPVRNSMAHTLAPYDLKGSKSTVDVAGQSSAKRSHAHLESGPSESSGRDKREKFDYSTESIVQRESEALDTYHGRGRSAADSETSKRRLSFEDSIAAREAKAHAHMDEHDPRKARLTRPDERPSYYKRDDEYEYDNRKDWRDRASAGRGVTRHGHSHEPHNSEIYKSVHRGGGHRGGRRGSTQLETPTTSYGATLKDDNDSHPFNPGQQGGKYRR